jgi:hypothetical protein
MTGYYRNLAYVKRRVMSVTSMIADNKYNEKMGLYMTQNIFYTETNVTFGFIQFRRQVVLNVRV